MQKCKMSKRNLLALHKNRLFSQTLTSFKLFICYRAGHKGSTVLPGIDIFFKRYFGNFDFSVRYCGII